MRPGRFATLLVGGLVTVMTALAAPGPAAAAPAPPSDPAARGSIGLCDRAGRPVTSGSVTDKPFVWRAVGSQAAPSPYDGKGTSGTLNAYQPRSGVPAAQWSGDTLTASSAYTSKAHPMAQATQLDFTLRDYLREYPAVQGGLVQLRLIVGAAGFGAAPQYADAFLRVSGSRWTVVTGSSSFSCTDGTAVSSEAEAGLVDKSGNAIGTAGASLRASAAAERSSAAGRRGSASATTRSGASASPTPSGSAPGSGSPVASSAAAAAESNGSSGGGGGAVLWIVLAVVVVLAAGGVLVWRRRAPGRPAD